MSLRKFKRPTLLDKIEAKAEAAELESKKLLLRKKSLKAKVEEKVTKKKK